MKKLTLSALTLAMLAPMAHADTMDFYGRFDYSVTSSDSGSATHNNKDGIVLENNFSRLGVKGDMSLSESTSVFYRIEVGVNGGTEGKSSNPFSARPTYLGVKHDTLGALAVGRIDPVFKMAKGGVDAMDMYSMKHDRLFAGDKRWGDSLEYKSARWNDMQLGVSYVMEDNHYEEEDARRDNGNYQVSLTYGDNKLKRNNVYLAAAYSDGIEDIQAYRAVARVKLDALQLGAMFQHTELVNPAKDYWQDREGSGFIVNARYQIDKLMLKAQYGQDDSGSGLIANRIYSAMGDAATVVPEISQWAVGAEYRISRSTLVHTEIGQFDVEQAQYNSFDDTIVSLGVRFDF
ncbi:porin [Shewanella submarina]|uniref:Porin n=1 Tax=Shewanella submarina TaxID=2016376 RepID=A0ABV7GH78_9GAMM|nr:porin [Shewanella submarina]MCL1038073.1 porin [Shewanella submarina]